MHCCRFRVVEEEIATQELDSGNDELFKRYIFHSLAEANIIIAIWSFHCDTKRQHS